MHVKNQVPCQVFGFDYKLYTSGNLWEARQILTICFFF